MKTPDEFVEDMRGKGTYRPGTGFVPSKSNAPISPAKQTIVFGFFFVFWVLLAYLGARKLSADRALSDPIKTATAIANVVEYHWSRGGVATYEFVAPETGIFISRKAGIGRWDYDDLAAGRAHSIKVHYLRADPHINAPARESDMDIPGDIWLIFIGTSSALCFGCIGYGVWRKRQKPEEG